MKSLIALITIVLSPCLAKVQKHEFTREPLAFTKIVKHVQQLHSELPDGKARKISWDIYKSSKTHKVNPEIMTSIIMVESTFRQDAVSSTGDVSMVQINCGIWVKEAKRLKMEMNCKRLKKDSTYAIDRMGAILNYLKVTYAAKDSNWFARYHSSTYDFKMAYLGRIQKHRFVASEEPLIKLASNLE